MTGLVSFALLQELLQLVELLVHSASLGTSEDDTVPVSPDYFAILKPAVCRIFC
jgi:hypothetical protein